VNSMLLDVDVARAFHSVAQEMPSAARTIETFLKTLHKAARDEMENAIGEDVYRAQGSAKALRPLSHIFEQAENMCRASKPVREVELTDQDDSGVGHI